MALTWCLPASAATYQCTTTAMRGNKWICKEDPSVCTFAFVVDEKSKDIYRKIDERNPRVPVVVDKWEDNVNFLMANEYVTNSGRYLTQEELNMADKKKYSYYRPRLFSEKGRCTFKR
ncbi:MAG: hypothetical protein EBV69_02895 [Oxalobacteraceae bacterium]|nr:hypothetical protein [Oxalobacteraceae bacterium]